MNEMVLLPTGYSIPLRNVEFDSASYHFFYGGLDVTDYLTLAQKLLFAADGYDQAVDFIRMSDDSTRRQGREPVHEKSVVGTFISGVGSDIASIGDNARSFFGIGEENAGKMSGLVKLTLLAGAGYLAFLYLKSRKP